MARSSPARASGAVAARSSGPGAASACRLAMTTSPGPTRLAATTALRGRGSGFLPAGRTNASGVERARTCRSSSTSKTWLRPAGKGSKPGSCSGAGCRGTTGGWGSSVPPEARVVSSSAKSPMTMPVPCEASQRFITQRSKNPSPSPAYPNTATPPRATHSLSTARSPSEMRSEARSGSRPPRRSSTWYRPRSVRVRCG